MSKLYLSVVERKRSCLKSGPIVGLNLAGGSSHTERRDLLRTDAILQNRRRPELKVTRDVLGISQNELDRFLGEICDPRRRKCVHARRKRLGRYEDQER